MNKYDIGYVYKSGAYDYWHGTTIVADNDKEAIEQLENELKKEDKRLAYILHIDESKL